MRKRADWLALVLGWLLWACDHDGPPVGPVGAAQCTDSFAPACFECLQQKCPDELGQCTEDPSCSNALATLNCCFEAAGLDQVQRRSCASTFGTSGGPAFALGYCFNFSTCGVDCATWTAP